MNVIKSALLVVVASVCKSVISGCLGDFPKVPACCSTSDKPRCYLPFEDPDCHKTSSDARFWCPPGKMPDKGSVTRAQALALGCWSR
ncbi:hypothetical protein MJO29_005414 [Puccinia striiformis f. sp. tritici]|uniref:CBM1 domain-containing protein n=3 Tax=Puccinia striiformis TaxID=27350 RepID=A0A0L0V133_9BASI|nr:hypothetical protein Pst134EB_010603 [Puccinia striiformis f. sp. tritici]KAI9630230.1 hypothetical protein KEM48_014153 [Puccinia striiformis f. sp. tritici PST-130]KNE92965.1 hypothetical protein PSTG_13680 [Puccinia striiformis f. sp. tritici PST-78]POW16097.1 hypothetical protein PSTT_01668 [Puccinia striiformis]KAI7960346.1 hypothetical protein MJO29_005414 [Puccinia striiformis f. sp. tritici]